VPQRTFSFTPGNSHGVNSSRAGFVACWSAAIAGRQKQRNRRAVRRLIAFSCGMSLRGFIGGGLYHSLVAQTLVCGAEIQSQTVQSGFCCM